MILITTYQPYWVDRQTPQHTHTLLEDNDTNTSKMADRESNLWSEDKELAIGQTPILKHYHI